MKKIDINAEFIAKKLKEKCNIESLEYWSDYFKKNLTILINESDETEDTYFYEIKEDVDSQYLMSYETYRNHYEYICGITDDETNSLYENYEKKLGEIENYCRKCEGIISSFPDAEYEIDFSKKSLSIYLVAKMPATEDNINKFLKSCNSYNIYEDFECDEYSHDCIKIRISDHDFGGNEWLSYREPCINIIV